MPKPKPKHDDVFTVTLSSEVWDNLVGVEDKALKALIDGPPDEGEGERAPDHRYRDVILPLLDQLPAREADMFQLYFIDQMRQRDIAYIFEVTQAAVSYRLTRAVQRLKFLIEVPKIDNQEVERLLHLAGFDRTDIEILILYRKLTSQTAVAEIVGVHQTGVRDVIRMSVKRLAKLAERDPAFDDVAKLFRMHREHGNILHELELPQWAGRGNVTKDETFSR